MSISCILQYVQGGGCTSVGVVGWMIGGGYGSASKMFGTGPANLLEARVVTADGRLVTWADVTESAEAAGQADKDKLVVQHQKLSNLLAAGEFGRALRLALRLSQPFTCLKIVKQLEYEQLKVSGVLMMD